MKETNYSEMTMLGSAPRAATNDVVQEDSGPKLKDFLSTEQTPFKAQPQSIGEVGHVRVKREKRTPEQLLKNGIRFSDG